MVVDEKQAKAARNQSLFREVNERVRRVSDNGVVPPTETIGFVCECADPGCTETIELLRAEYESARRSPTRFPTAVGHEWPDVERVVERTDRYQVVEKIGDAARIAVENAPSEPS